MSRGLTEERLVELAVDFGRLIPTPPDLSSEGFYRWSEAGEDTIRRWWTLQSEALRVLVRPNTFQPQDMNLPRGATGGYPTPLDVHLRRPADRTVPERQETISRALNVLYAKPEKEEVNAPEPDASSRYLEKFDALLRQETGKGFDQYSAEELEKIVEQLSDRSGQLEY